MIGRKKDKKKSKNRVHSVVLSFSGEEIFERVSALRGGDKKWFHKFINDSLEKKFGKNREMILLNELSETQKLRDDAEDKIVRLADRISKIREKRENER